MPGTTPTNKPDGKRIARSGRLGTDGQESPPIDVVSNEDSAMLMQPSRRKKGRENRGNALLVIFLLLR